MPQRALGVDGLRGKSIDTLGHDQGDALLKTCAHILRQSFRESDILARAGGDEFVALLPHTPGAEAETVVNKVRSAIDRYNQNQDQDSIPI